MNHPLKPFFIAFGLSNFGNTLFIVAVLWTLSASGNSAASIGTFLAVSFLPMIVFNYVGGELADRLNNRTTVIWIELAGATLMVLLLAVGNVSDYGYTTLLIFNVLICSSFSLSSPAVKTLQRDLTEPGFMKASNSVASLVQELARLSGALLVAPLYSMVGFQGVIAANGLSFAISAVIIATNVPPTRSTATPPDAIAPTPCTRHTARVLLKDPELAKPFLYLALLCTSYGSLTTILPIYVRDELLASVGTYSILRGALSFGAVAATLYVLANRIEKISANALLVLLCGCAAALIFSVVGNAISLAVFVAAYGLLHALFLIDIFTLVHTRVANPHTGRATSYIYIVAATAIPIGHLLGGFVAEVCSDQALMLIGALILLAALITRVVLDR